MPTSVRVNGHDLAISNAEKVLYPKSRFTKGDVIDYYRRIAKVLVPHLSHRALTLKRYPNGVDGMFFYEKNCPSHRPAWIKTVRVWSEGNQRDMDYCSVENEAALVWTANLAALELHISLSKASALATPTSLVFDLDPGAPADALDCAKVALRMRNLFAQWSLQSFIKSSGKKGLQLYVPLNQRAATYEQTKTFSHAIAKILEQETPELVVSSMAKAQRRGKVFIDWSQNDPHKTTVAVYSLRADLEPTVSAPLTWSEVEAAVKNKSAAGLRFTAPQVLSRIKKYGDLFAPLLTLKQKLPGTVTATSSPKKKTAKPAIAAKALKRQPRLIEYANKRDFSITSEPAPSARAKSSAKHPTFMVHKHHASHLHYDLRLEMDGALASWAIPKGPTYDPKIKRLAIQTEDHPLAYGNFEGRIPEGQYGAGDSIIWDRGFYDTLPPGLASAQRKKGHLHLVFAGDKLKGGFHLIRTNRGSGNKAQWLFFKSSSDMPEDAPKDLVEDRPESVVSGRRATRGPATVASKRHLKFRDAKKLLASMFPPMLASLRDALPSPASEWILELKYDGYRAVAALAGGDVAMWTRNRIDLCQRFPSIAESLAKIAIGDAVLDGEIVALDKRKRPSFARIGEGNEQYFVFDLLWLQGCDLRRTPIERRRELLESLLAAAPDNIRASERLTGDWQKALARSGKRGFEGLVAKRVGSHYEARRSSSWIKLKLGHRQELAIVGYRNHSSQDKQVGALLLGVMEHGHMRYAGKVGTGFNDATRRALFKELSRDISSTPTASDAPRAKVSWVKPRLVAEVSFSEWTADHRLRHPVFLGLRPDKSPRDCIRERALRK